MTNSLIKEDPDFFLFRASQQPPERANMFLIRKARPEDRADSWADLPAGCVFVGGVDVAEDGDRAVYAVGRVTQATREADREYKILGTFNTPKEAADMLWAERHR